MGEPAKPIDFPRWSTLDEYFKLAAESLEKLEFRGNQVFPLRGEIVAMAGGTEYHGLIVGNLAGAIWPRLADKPCRYYPADFRVSVRNLPTYTYTDGHVICGPTLLDDRDPTRQTALNPSVIFEVLSPSTEAYDRGAKFKRYLYSESLQEYVLVTQNEPRIEIFLRRPDGSWLFRYYLGLTAIAPLQSISIELPLMEIYRGVIFPPDPNAPQIPSDEVNDRN